LLWGSAYKIEPSFLNVVTFKTKSKFHNIHTKLHQTLKWSLDKKRYLSGETFDIFSMPQMLDKGDSTYFSLHMQLKVHAFMLCTWIFRQFLFVISESGTTIFISFGTLSRDIAQVQSC